MNDNKNIKWHENTSRAVQTSIHKTIGDTLHRNNLFFTQEQRTLSKHSVAQKVAIHKDK